MYFYIILLFYCSCHAPRLLLPSTILLIGISKCYKIGRDVFPFNLKMNWYLILLFYCCCHAPRLLLPSTILLIGTQSHPTRPAGTTIVRTIRCFFVVLPRHRSRHIRTALTTTTRRCPRGRRPTTAAAGATVICCRFVPSGHLTPRLHLVSRRCHLTHSGRIAPRGHLASRCCLTPYSHS